MPTIRAGDINLEYYSEGSGPPLLMIMGFAGQANSWGEPMLEGLRPHFNCIRFSNRGTGQSDKPEKPTTIREMADDAVALLDALGLERPHVFGVSMGGMIAQEIAINYPQRVNGLVLGCTLPGAAHGVSPAPEVVVQMAPTPGLSREEQVRKAWPAICAPSFLKENLEFLEKMLVVSLTNPTPIETIGRQGAAVSGFDSFDRLPQIKAPTLIIHGDADRLVPPENAPILQKQISGSELRIIPGAAHMFFWEKPEESARLVVEFLSRVAAAA